MKAEGVSEKVDGETDEDRMQTQITLTSPTKPPDRKEKLNGMEEKDEEENEFWKKEEEGQKRQNEEVEKVRRQREADEGEDEEEYGKEEMNWYEKEGGHGLSQEVTETIDGEGEEGR